MYEDLPEENLQEMVTIGYGMEMEKRGIDKGRAEGISIGKAEGCRLTEKKYKKAFNEALAASGISEKQKTEIMENLKKFSSD